MNLKRSMISIAVLSSMSACTTMPTPPERPLTPIAAPTKGSSYYAIDKPALVIKPIPKQEPSAEDIAMKAADDEKAGVVIKPIAEADGKAAKVQHKWVIHRGDKISDVLSAWCKTNNWVLIWEAPEVIAESDAGLDGDLERAVALVIDALNRNGGAGGIALRPMLYKDNSPIVLRVTERK